MTDEVTQEVERLVTEYNHLLAFGYNGRARGVQKKLKALRATLNGEKKMDELMIDSEVCCMVRSAAKRVTGGNATFIDDDIKLLEHLASRAVAAGLVDELHPDVARAALNAAGGKQDGR